LTYEEPSSIIIEYCQYLISSRQIKLFIEKKEKKNKKKKKVRVEFYLLEIVFYFILNMEK